MDALLKGKGDDQIVASLKADKRFEFLSTIEPERKSQSKNADFSKDTKSAAYLREALGNPPVKCHICAGYMHKNSIHVDHDKTKKGGGTGDLKNAKLAHPYCDSSKGQVAA